MDEVSTVDADKTGNTLSSQLFSQIGLPAFIISTFFPHLMHTLSRYPKLVRLLSLPLALWIGWEFLSAKLSTLWYTLMSTAMSSVCIDSGDGSLHASFCSLLRGKKLMDSHREMSAASTQYLRNHVNQGHYLVQQLGSGNLVFNSLNKLHFFWHDGRLFLLTVERKEKYLYSSNLTIWTFGWSPEPIRKMLNDAYAGAMKKNGRVLTQIYVPYEGRSWTQRCTKPRRPLGSVYLADGQKKMLLNDMGEYLDDKTVRWYEDRGIPHRRGYLFHGRPGTGKTTLALALAGHFKLQVYMLSLLDNDVTDNTLLMLFQSIGRGKLILLEDVDCAGIERRPTGPSKPRSRKTKGKSSEDGGPGVTLSGLLNAIDGAGAPEGHVLIMTTNKPNSLDEALVRAGRVDVRVEFCNATRSQLRDIFINMYAPCALEGAETSFYIRKEDKHEESSSSIEEAAAKAEAAKENEKHKDKIHALAEKFAENVPEDRFSPADLQDYLVLHKNRPQVAVDEVGAWVAEKLGEKAENGQDDSPNDSESGGEDNIFTENQSERSTAASSADGESPEIATSNEQSANPKDQTTKATKGCDKPANGVSAEIIDLASKLRELDPKKVALMLDTKDAELKQNEKSGKGDHNVPVKAGSGGKDALP